MFNIPIKMLASSLEKNVPTYLCENLQIIRMQKSLTKQVIYSDICSSIGFCVGLHFSAPHFSTLKNFRKLVWNWSRIGPDLIRKWINYWCNIKSNHSFPFFIAFCPINNPKCWFSYFQIGSFNGLNYVKT